MNKCNAKTMSVVNNPIAPSGALVATLSSTKISNLMNTSISKANTQRHESAVLGVEDKKSSLDATMNKINANLSTQDNALTNENLFKSSGVMDARVRFIIEFVAGAAGGAVSRTA